MHLQQSPLLLQRINVPTLHMCQSKTLTIAAAASSSQPYLADAHPVAEGEASSIHAAAKFCQTCCHMTNTIHLHQMAARLYKRNPSHH